LYKKIAAKEVSEIEILNYFRGRKTNIIERFIGGIFGKSQNDDEIEITENDDVEFSKRNFVINSNDQFEFSPCCKALPGDECIAYRSFDGAITIHKRECKEAIALNSSDGKNTAAVKWQMKNYVNFPAEIFFEGSDRRNILIDVLNIISDQMHLNMISLDIKAKLNYFSGTIKFEVPHKDIMQKLVKEIAAVRDVKKVYRI
jgi:GTP pyrophosphokinase